MRYKALDSCLSFAALALCLWALEACGVFGQRYSFLENWHLALDLPAVMIGYVFASRAGMRRIGPFSFLPSFRRRLVSNAVVFGLIGLVLLAVIGLAQPSDASRHLWQTVSAHPAAWNALTLLVTTVVSLHVMSVASYQIWSLPVRPRTLVALALTLLAFLLLLIFQRKQPDQGAVVAVRAMAAFWAGIVARLLPALVEIKGDEPKLAMSQTEVLALAMGVYLVLASSPGPLQLLTPMIFGLVCWTVGAESGLVSRRLRRSRLASIGHLSFAWPLAAAGFGPILADQADRIALWRQAWAREFASADAGFKTVSFDLILTLTFLAVSFLAARLFKRIGERIASRTVRSQSPAQGLPGNSPP